jgi:hypothetical protein
MIINLSTHLALEIEADFEPDVTRIIEDGIYFIPIIHMQLLQNTF